MFGRIAELKCRRIERDSQSVNNAVGVTKRLQLQKEAVKAEL